MAKKQQRNQGKAERVEVRLESPEKEGFQRAADIAGIPLSVWVRERLRRAAARELEERGEFPPFLRHLVGG